MLPFHAIRPATAWALLCMEAALALVVVALLSTPLLVVLLPLGYALTPRTRHWRRLNPGWLGLWLSIAVWAVSNYGALAAGPIGAGRLMLWWMTGVLPVLVGLGLWWRGGVLAQTEIGTQDVRTEFVILGGVGLGALIMLRGLANPPIALIAAAGLAFTASGLLALSLARQDAAEAQRSGGARSLAGLSAAAPTGGGLLLAGVLTPALVAALWAAFGTLLQVLLAPFVFLLQWLASLLPRLGPGAGLPPGLFDRQPLPDLSELQRQAAPPVWLAWLILGLFALMAVSLVVVIVRLLLAWSGARREQERWLEEEDVQSEAVGNPRRDARALLDWLWAWLRRRLFGGPGPARLRPGSTASQLDAGPSDVRQAYRSLLAWARAQGLARRESETTQQFRRRLDRHLPEAAATFELITDVYEWDRYGQKPSTRERLAAVRRQLEQLLSGPTTPPT